MTILLQPCKSLCSPNYSLPVNSFTVVCNAVQNKAYPSIPKWPALKPSNFHSFSTLGPLQNLGFTNHSPSRRGTHVAFCSRNEVFDGFSSTQVPQKPESKDGKGNEELELLNKPSPIPINNGVSSELDKECEKPGKEEALEPFLKFFKGRDDEAEVKEEAGVLEEKFDVDDKYEEANKVGVEYYEPKPGDFVVGVVVSGNENKLDLNVGADLLGTMLTKEVLPLYDKEMEYLLCDMDRDANEFMVRGKMGIVKNDEALGRGSAPGRPVVETGTVLFAEVLGRTLSGRPLLSTRRFFRRISWHRVRQIKQLNEPIEVKITEWNTGGLLTRIEGLRAFLPKAELLNRVNNFSELKENVGRQIYVQITRIDETKNDLILSEREAWEKLYLSEGTLLEGTVKKIFPYGAQIRIGETNRSGLLHISNITRGRITSVSDLLAVDEKVKVLVAKSMFPDKISLSIADLESEPGLFVSNKEKVFAEAAVMAKKYREKLPAGLAPYKSELSPTNALPFDNEASMYANWKWFKFEREDGPAP
ncbi:protein PIGMENT DEFECTIVE 338, chloroplastic isoform X1 [Juglans microcarpa x Juglans regia]|uniref:protein PIGMENT DEFECTIVE 338, chloroplastic isoform X1 n=1 Tax=Juglans microcarpa x Juglans regia TaxID=2249226 RepID=UPI001B7EC928|nr:protein PIGMENT DEFECTIVE 338, chloroplastic isoform X1 [Juglans microcarpa x Juglans regia]